MRHASSQAVLVRVVVMVSARVTLVSLVSTGVA